MTRAAHPKPFACADCNRRFKSEPALSDHRRDAHGYAPPVAVEPQHADPACAECGKVARLVGGIDIYPHRPDLYQKRFWRCECGAYCGCHGVTTRPLGYPAGPETRSARSAAHAAFDPLWRSRRITRQDAYARLALAMNLEPDDCHIGMFTADQARRVVEIVEQGL